MNPRIVVDEEKIKGLAQSIFSSGMQDDIKGVRLPNGKIGVIDGGRRLRACQMLEERCPGWADTNLIAVSLKDENVEAAALVCNIQREELTPLEEIVGYRGCSATMTVDEIAMRFGVSRRHVKQRLRFAWLPDPILEALGKGELGMDGLEAYAMAKSADAALAVFSRLDEHNRYSAYAIRRALGETRVESTSPFIKLINPEAYTARGGVIEQDLFGEGGYYQDGHIVQELLAERLAAEVHAVKAEGWCWAEAVTTLGLQSANIEGLARAAGRQRGLTAEEDERYQELLGKQWRGITPEERTELSSLGRLRTKMLYADEVKGVAGVLLYVTHEGGIGREEGLIRPEELSEAKAKGLVGVNRGSMGGALGGAAPKQAREPGSLSKRLKTDLRSIRTAAVQHAIAEDPGLAFDLLVYALGDGNNAGNWTDFRSVVGIRQNEGSIWHGDVMDGRDGVVEHEAIMEREKIRDGFAMFRNRSFEEKMAVLAAAVARSVRDPSFEDRRSMTFDDIGVTISANMRQVWTPTFDNFLNDAPKARLFEIAEALGLDMKAIKGMRKDALARCLHDVFNDPETRAAHPASVVEAADRWRPEDEDFAANARTGATGGADEDQYVDEDAEDEEMVAAE